jgi:hypothetical protein
MTAPTAPSRPRAAQVSRTWETASAQVDSRLMEDARRRWAALPNARQMQLARSLAECRRTEFTRAVRQVVAVAAGLKRSNDSDGVEHLHNQPCIVFVVRRKIPLARLTGRADQALPTELLTPVWIDGEDRPVAVPTDVQAQDRFLGGRAQSVTAVRTESADGRWSFGVMAWALTVGSKRYAVAPIHVLSPLPALDGVGRRKGSLSRDLSSGSSGQSTLAQSADFGGRLSAGSALSFDVQLADITDASGFSNLFGGLRLCATRPWVRSESELDTLLADGRSLEIHAPLNNARRKSSDGQPPLSAVRSMSEQSMRLTYDFSDGSRRDIAHRVLELQVRFRDRTLPGDSGCPVLLPNDNDDPTLVGMHIAGNSARRISFMIPAWRILSAQSYLEVEGVLPPGPLKLALKP